MKSIQQVNISWVRHMADHDKYHHAQDNKLFARFNIINIYDHGQRHVVTHSTSMLIVSFVSSFKVCRAAWPPPSINYDMTEI